MKTILRLIALPVLCLLLAAASAGAVLVPVNLRCDYVVNPAGVDSPNPRLFWNFDTTANDQKQSAFQVLVASSARLLAHDQGDIWDSGKVTSDETIQIPCPGDRLKSSEQVFWKVRAWDAYGKISAWSRPATWTMGVLDPAGWQAAQSVFWL